MVTDEDITAYHAAGWLLGVLLYTPMLGMQKGGHKETPPEAPPHAQNLCLYHDY
jgi:hypothetical protein